MTRRLILMRHAKSSWSNPLEDDFDRPLNGRGRVSAKAVGEWLRTKKYIPDQILSSSSKRTRETYVGLGLAADTTFLDRLYHAGPDQMMDVLRGASGHSVLMLGHNPGISFMAEIIVKSPPIHTRFHDYPTCATLICDFDIEQWRDLKPGSGQVVDFVIPRELTG